MQRGFRATAIALIAIVGIGANSVDAGDSGGTATIVYHFGSDAGAGAAARAAVPEIYQDGRNITGTHCPAPAISNPLGEWQTTLTCPLPNGDYTVGVDGLTDRTVASVRCSDKLNEMIESDDANFTVEFGYPRCDVYISPNPILYIDKVVANGPAAASDFGLEVYDSDGGTAISTLVDPSDTACVPTSPNGTDCVAIQLEPGNYYLGETSATGYLPTSLQCAPVNPGDDEQLPTPQFGSVTLSLAVGDVYCTLTNEYFTQTVSADINVINDDGGTADGAAFTIEVYDATNTLVASGVDPAPGTGNASATFVLPIGDYSFGVSGPDGYTTTVVVAEVELPSARIDDPSSAFSLGRFTTATAVITANDPVPIVTTSTTTTSIATVSTIPATTVDPNAVLPATGTSSPTLLMWALVLLLIGSGTIVVARRP